MRAALDVDRVQLALDRDNLNAERQRIINEAQEQGYRDGQANALTDFKQTIQPFMLSAIDGLRQRLDDLNQIVKATETKLVESVSRNAISLAKRLIGEHYQMNPDSVVDSIRPILLEAVHESYPGQEIVFIANPDTLSRVASFAGAISSSGVILQADQDMQPGGARVMIRDLALNRTIVEWDVSLERRIADLGAPD